MAVLDLGDVARIGRRTRTALAAGSLLLLAACAGAGNPTTPPAAYGAYGASADPYPASPSTTGQPAREQAAAIAPPPPTTPPQDVQKLVGLKGEVLRQWMGETVFVRHDGIAEIWRFASDKCFLDVFLYRERDGLRVAHLDARSRNGNQRFVTQTCYGAILADRKKSAS